MKLPKGKRLYILLRLKYNPVIFDLTEDGEIVRQNTDTKIKEGEEVIASFVTESIQGYWIEDFEETKEKPYIPPDTDE